MLAIFFGVLGLLVGAVVNRTVPKLVAETKRRWLSCEHSRAGWPATVALLTRHRTCQECGPSALVLPALVEVGTGVVFAGLWLRFGPSLELALSAVYSAVFVLIFVVDMGWRLVPNKVVFPAAVFAVAGGLFWPGPISSLVGGLVGFGLLLLLYVVFPGGMGAGDVKLAALIGLIAGWPGIILALVLGFAVGGLAAALLLLTRRAGLRSHMPYAPSLVIGAMTVMLFGQDILSWYLGTYHVP